MPEISKKEKSETMAYAGFWSRLAAFVIDQIIICICIFIILIFLPKAFSGPLQYSGDIILAMFVTLAFLIYNIFFLNKYQKTPGRKMVGMRIVANNGTKMTLNQIFLREMIASFFYGSLIYFGLKDSGFVTNLFFSLKLVTICSSYIIMALIPRKQTLYDVIANTVVVYTDQKPNKAVKFVTLAMVGVYVAVVVFGMIGIMIFFWGISQ